MKRLLFHSEATAELEEAVSFYEGRSQGLGSALLAEVELAASRIQEHPGIGSPYKETAFRHYVLRRFPFLIFYLELPDAIWIAAVAHGKRRPGYWRHREIELERPGEPEALS
jgi:toxin ParE1/3/4